MASLVFDKLIDADKLMKAIKDFRWVGPPNTLQLMFSYLRIILRDQPAVDAVEVVRCKDCKHSVWDEENEMWKCVESADYDEDAGEWFGFYEYHNGDFFCADGERKDNED